ncbi:MAG TPA: hypothetical protein VGV38_15270 [Pyrinomonadaceae bacterium]|nr:hypothetical protein [Pyrinomonadaceae bacterium]
MKHEFEIRYELDAPLAVSVGLYLDCEHYIFLHRALSNRLEVLEAGADSLTYRQSWNVFGLAFGQVYKSRYVAPATFVNYDVEPSPRWLPSVHHLVKVRTTLRYYETDRRTTLSRLTVELQMPGWLAPLKGFICRTIERVKILKDLEDAAVIDRRARLFGRLDNSAFLKRRQFLLHKDEYLRHFGPGSEFRGDPSLVGRKERWPDIRELPHAYVRKFLKESYPRITNFPHTPRAEAEPAHAGGYVAPERETVSTAR